ncbi:MAG TPA: response regulator transcription factor [Candidatus Aquilonibacter sp.]|nr:response regulator transcription factor [Candidatus Aquilonibacter sp.]
MPTLKKVSDYRPRGPRNLIELPGKLAGRLRESEVSQILRRDERFTGKAPNGESQGRTAPGETECRLLPAEIRTKEPCTLMVADDHPVVREGLVAMIERQPNMRVVAQASNGREAVDQFLTRRPDVGLLDLRMPGMNGVDAVVAICEREPEARLMILTTYQGQEEIYRALRAGALGYLLKDAPAEELVESIRAVSAGRTWIPPAVGAKLAQRVTDRQLTAREMEVLGILAVGKSNKEIGVAFNISEATVKVHVTHILEKLKVTGRTEAINAAVRRGLVNMDSATAA